MKRYSLFIVGLIMIALLAVSCSSTPEAAAPEPEQPEQTDSVAAIVPAPDGELQKAEELKKSIDDFGLASALPDEYQKGNEELEAGRAALGGDNRRAKSLLDSSAVRYQAVIDAAVEQKLKSRQNEITAAKAQADSVKAARAAAEQYALGSDKVSQSKNLYDAKEYLEAWTISGEAVNAYNESYRIARAKRDNADGELKKTSGAQKTADIRIEEVSKEIGGNAQ
ncbi:MAG: hypothetical protein LBT68_05695 [Spirochaetales bacterium]|jgi:hypothetical protein|nr:hypothetical protein [Spirochaetales bacterium]